MGLVGHRRRVLRPFLLLAEIRSGPTVHTIPDLSHADSHGRVADCNVSWNWIFFRKKDLWLSFVFFVLYLLLAFALAGVLHRIRNPFSGWYALYLAYLVYATWWGYRVWRLNRGSSQNS